MKRAATLSTGQLKEGIASICSDARLRLNQKIVKIFQLDKDIEEPIKTPWLNGEGWTELKKDIVFWRSVITLLNINNPDPFVTIGENDAYTTIDITSIIGNTGLLGEIMTTISSLPAEEQQQKARTLYENYMRWYDSSPMARNYRNLYARYLVRTDRLVPMANTREQTNAVPLNAVEVENDEYAFFTILSLIATPTNKKERHVAHYVFTQKREEPETLFIIMLDPQKTIKVPVRGLINRIVKFVYNDRLLLLITGDDPADNKLVRCRIDLDNLSEIPFKLPANLYFDDLIVVDLDREHRYATHMKARVGEAILFDVGYLANISENEPINYLLSELPISLSHKYVTANGTAFTTNDRVILASRSIRHHQPDTQYCLALIVKRFTGDPTAPWAQELCIYKYTATMNVSGVLAMVIKPVVESYVIFTLDNFIAPGQELRDFNIVFHTKSIFYVEALVESQKLEVVNSRLFQYDFKFATVFGNLHNKPVTVPNDDNMKLLELIRTKNYRVYDLFRHIDMPGGIHKYDCLFYKHNYEKKHARIIYYKSYGTQAAVANLTLRQMAPFKLLYIFPLPVDKAFGALTFFTQSLVKVDKTHLKNLLSEKPINIRIYEIENLVEYKPQNFSLDASFAKNLRLSDLCVHCHTEANKKDILTGHLFCDELCQRIYCKTLRL